jgi:hypothetical protein
MSISIADLRKQRTSDFAGITASLNKKSDFARDDEGFWKPERDKSGNASAVIRFLPKHPDDELPWVQIYNHAFQGPGGKWYIENCLSTLGQDDPVQIANRALYATGLDADKKLAGVRKRKLSYITNILVISDPRHPENEGSVFYFKFGKKIFEKITEKLQPTFEDETPVKVFDLWEGAEFKLRMAQVEGFPNYDKSVFSEPKEIGTDAEIVAIMNKQKPLSGLVAPSKFKSYAELESKFKMVIGEVGSGNTSAEKVMEQMRSEPVAVAPAPKAPKPVAAKIETPPSGDDSDDMEKYFKQLSGS